MEMEAKLTTRGRVTIPRGLRESLKLRGGDNVIFEQRGDDIVMYSAAVDPTASARLTVRHCTPVPNGDKQ